MYIYVYVYVYVCVYIYTYVLNKWRWSTKENFEYIYILGTCDKDSWMPDSWSSSTRFTNFSRYPLPEQVKKKCGWKLGVNSMYTVLILYILQIAISLKPEIHFKNQSFWVSIPLICGRYTYPKQILPKDLPFGVRCSYHPIEDPYVRHFCQFFFWQTKTGGGFTTATKKHRFPKKKHTILPPQKIGGGGCGLFFFGEKVHVFFHAPTWELWKKVQVDDRYGVAVVGAVPWVWVSKIFIKLRVICQQQISDWLKMIFYGLRHDKSSLSFFKPP